MEIRPIRSDDHDRWIELFGQYADFYRSPLAPAAREVVWCWLMTPTHPVEGLVALDDDVVVGFLHFRAVPSSLTPGESGFIDDIYVHPTARGRRLSAALIEAVAEIGRDRGWPSLQWVTADDNYRARVGYDRVATRTAWVTYEQKLSFT